MKVSVEVAVVIADTSPVLVAVAVALVVAGQAGGLRRRRWWRSFYGLSFVYFEPWV